VRINLSAKVAESSFQRLETVVEKGGLITILTMLEQVVIWRLLEMMPKFFQNQIALAIGQWKNRWTMDSSSKWHKGQVGSPLPTLRTKFLFVGRMLDLILQSNILYLSCTFSFHILVHGVLGMIVKEGRLFLKADWTENLPFGSRIQTSLSRMGIKGIGILLIASTESIHKISFNFGKSQDLVAWWIRQDTTKLSKL
jgi:hypothetical protein